jgi:hypothetical protein
MLNASISWHAARFNLARSLRWPYLAFFSGGIIGALATVAIGVLPADSGAVDSPAIASESVPTDPNSGAIQPAGAEPASHDRQPVYYYIVDTSTKAPVLAGAMTANSTSGDHQEFVIVGKQDEAETLIRLDLALLELSAAGVPVKLIDLR